MKHELPELPFSKDAFKPVISAETFEYHHGKHHRAYVNKLNELIVGTPFESKTLETIIMEANGPIFNNASQIWNHTFFWNSITPGGSKPAGQLLASIQSSFGSLEGFKEAFIKAAVGQFGSGWAWLVKTNNGSLAIETTSNAENPMRNGKKPLLTVDVWEHAYYIDYRNERPRYVDTLWNVLNFDFAARNFT